MSAIMRDRTPPPSVRCSMRPFGRPERDFTEEPEFTKQPVLRKQMIDDMTDFHGFITPGGKLSSQRLEDECSTALPSQCTNLSSLESLPTTPAGFGTLMPPPPMSGQGWFPGKGLSLDGGRPDGAAFSDFIFEDLDFPNMGSDFKRSVTELSDVLCALESPLELGTPPSTPRQDRMADRTCPLAPGDTPYPPLLKALSQNNLDLVVTALETDPDGARAPFWDHNTEPPLCAAIRLGCTFDIVAFLLKSGADVKATNFAGQTPLDVLACARGMRTMASSKELKELLLSAGAEPSETSASAEQQNQLMMKDMLRWDPLIIDAGTFYDFGLPPSVGSIHDFGLPPSPGFINDFCDFEPPPPVGGVA